MKMQQLLPNSFNQHIIFPFVKKIVFYRKGSRNNKMNRVNVLEG